MPLRIQVAAWRTGLSTATTVEAVVQLVQRIAWAYRTTSSHKPSPWQPRQIRSREDIEHWARRVQLNPAGGERDVAYLRLLLPCALERMNAIGPARFDEATFHEGR
jgi:hypothetical protein